MKKKLMGIAILAVSALSYADAPKTDVQLKVGFDFFRALQKINDGSHNRYDMGFTVNFDVLPINALNNRLEFGAGLGLSTGLKSFFMQNTAYPDNTFYFFPLYGMMKLNLVNLQNGDSPLYLFTRAGYAFTGDKQAVGGAYLGGGIGTEFSYFVAEAMYSATFVQRNYDNATTPNKEWSVLHQVGIQLGARFMPSTKVTPQVVEKPVVVEKIVEKVVEKRVVVEKPVVVEQPKPVEQPKVEQPKIETPKSHGMLVNDVKTQKDSGLSYKEFNLEDLPEVILVTQDNYLSPVGKGIYRGANGQTDANYVYLVDPKDKVVLSGNSPLILKPFRLSENPGYKIITEKDGRKRIAVNIVAPKEEKVVLFPSHCSEDKCIINGFSVDSRTPDASEIEQIKLFVDTVNKFADSATVRVVGHTDSQGSAVYNKKLGQQRANTIANLLKNNGLKPSIKIVTVTSDGEDNPMDTNSTAAGRYQNRRVELIFTNLIR